MLQPFDKSFNAAVLTMANLCWPRGWNVADKAPESFEELRAEYLATGRITVWSGGSEDTIFGDPEVNYAFRAWHDWVHIGHSLPFTLEGEKEAADIQKRMLHNRYGETNRLWAQLIDIEVKEQAKYFAEHKRFPDKQRHFAYHRLLACGYEIGVEL